MRRTLEGGGQLEKLEVGKKNLEFEEDGVYGAFQKKKI